MVFAVGFGCFALGLAVGMLPALWFSDRAYRDLRDRRIGGHQ